MARVRSVLVLVAVALLAGGCSGEVMRSQLHLANSDTFFRYGASADDMLTVIVGTPFPASSRKELDKAVTDAMQYHHNGPMTHFTTNPGPNAHLDYRIVVAFNTPSTMMASALCGDPDSVPTGYQHAGRLQAEIGFCVASDLYSSVDVSIPAVASPDDPAFRHMIANAMWALIPARDPLSSDEGYCVGPNC